MKMRYYLLLIAAWLLVGITVGCGQTGPLILPPEDETQAGATVRKGAPSATEHKQAKAIRSSSQQTHK